MKYILNKDTRPVVPLGQRCPHQMLELEIIEARNYDKSGKSIKKLAKKFDISYYMMRKIIQKLSKLGMV